MYPIGSLSISNSLVNHSLTLDTNPRELKLMYITQTHKEMAMKKRLRTVVNLKISELREVSKI